ncbi:transcriptional attenuator, LytR family [Streptoalloteichus hindustanus]|uniref:Transcriptional attenuator, LytR family n=1 Tax=Streptoalloteichus hindustanus TaxID=2017 RepID=A0A1M5MYM1_STRHI|nr:transcriptional attenuator, LytR family [Streptoalloteichus hindustanus]
MATASVCVLLACGVAWSGYRDLADGLTTSDAIGGESRVRPGEPVNVLLIGLDSRKDQNGEMLPKEILEKLHAGDGTQGGYNTNTLILMHIPADGGKARAFSIPRDDYVSYVGIPGETKGKIKEAYGRAKYHEEQKLAAQGVHDRPTLEKRGREAGRRATLDVVRELTGVRIDHFAEVNLAGFYDLATALNGVEVCLNNPVRDSFSGADFPAGRQTLDGSQSLAFVRQRHGLTNGDLDRTRRQQAFLASVAHKLRGQGVLTDPAALGRLLDVAKKDVVIDKGWDLLTFARQSQNLTGGDMRFETLPIEGFQKINGQDVNLVDPAKIKAIVREAFGERPAEPAAPADPTGSRSPSTTVDVLNASGVDGLAATVSSALAKQGYRAGDVQTVPGRASSLIRYGDGARADAEKIAQTLGGLPVQADRQVPANRVWVLLGSNFRPPRALPAPSGSPAGVGPAAAHGVPVAPQAPAPPGHSVDMGGIPCVD